MNTFQISADMLNLLSYLVYIAATGQGSSCFTNRTMTFGADGSASIEGNTYWLEDLFEVYEEDIGKFSKEKVQKKLEHHLVMLAFDQLLFDETNALASCYLGTSLPTKEFKRQMFHKGLMIHNNMKDEPSFPKAVADWLDIRAKLFAED